MTPVALGIVFIGAALLASAAGGALAAVVIHSRQGCSARVVSGVSLTASGTVLTVEASSLALAGAPGQGCSAGTAGLRKPRSFSQPYSGVVPGSWPQA